MYIVAGVVSTVPSSFTLYSSTFAFATFFSLASFFPFPSLKFSDPLPLSLSVSSHTFPDNTLYFIGLFESSGLSLFRSSTNDGAISVSSSDTLASNLPSPFTNIPAFSGWELKSYPP